MVDSPSVYAQNIRAMVDVVGAEHVCLGTDSKMATASDGNSRMGKTTNQSWENAKEGFLYEVIDSLMKTGFSDKEIIQISGSNYCRIFDKATSI